MVERFEPKELTQMQALLMYATEMRKSSACERARHACVLTDLELDPLSRGYNGPERGAPNQCLRPDEEGNCGCVHAEANALIKPQRECHAKIAFITSEPCERCARMMVNARVVMVVYQQGHRPYAEGLEVLENAGVPHGRPQEMVDVLLAMRRRNDLNARLEEVMEWTRKGINQLANQTQKVLFEMTSIKP